jgi:prepilin-type processing-associated H-X9-DG protein
MVQLGVARLLFQKLNLDAAMQLTCPHCGATTDAADEQAGQTGNCAQCGKAVSVPPDGGVARKRETFLGLDLGMRSLTCGLLFFLLIIGCDVVGVGISTFLPAVQAAREAARRGQCAKNLQTIGLAMQLYQQKYGCFPPSFIPDENGKPKHSWRVLILPFLEKEDLYAKYRFDEPWDGPHNKALADQMPSVFRCPSSPMSDPSQTSYAMIVGPHVFSDGPTARRQSDIKDGPANTIMLAEAGKADIPWMEPRDLNVEKMDFCTRAAEKDLRRETCEIFRNHGMVANVLFCDGSVRPLRNESVSPKELEGMMTIDGGEPVPKIEGR